jgi:hypothetical protein
MAGFPMCGAQRWLAEREWLAGSFNFDYLLELEAKKEMYFDFMKGSYTKIFDKKI